MKKSWIKTAFLSTFALSTQIGYSEEVSFVSPQPAVSQVKHFTNQKRSYAHFLGLQTDENLKAYHIGLKALFPNHTFLTQEKLTETIRSMPQFCTVNALEEGRSLLKASPHPFLVVEEEIGHFYVVHDKGERHFTVRATQMDKREIGSIDNGFAKRYPIVCQFLESTLNQSFMRIPDIELLKISAIDSLNIWMT